MPKRSSTLSIAEQTSRLGQIHVGGRVGYALMDGAVEPFVRARYEHDFAKSDVDGASDSDHGIGVGAGIAFNIAPNVTAGIESNTVLFRDDYTQVSGRARVHINF